MLRITSRTLVTALTVVCTLAVASPAAAQKAKRGSSRPSAVRVSSRSQARSSPRAKANVSRARAPSSARVKSSPRPQTRSVKSSVSRVRTQSRPQVKSSVRVKSSARVKSTARPQTRSVKSTARTIKTRTANKQDAARRTVRVNPAPTQRVKARAADGLRRKVVRGTKSYEVERSDARQVIRAGDRDRYAGKVRGRLPANERRYVVKRPRGRQYYDYRRPRHRGNWVYYRGYRSPYRYGYYNPYYFGYCYGGCYRHYHYYGPSLLFGWHYGGFGFYHGRWHFALVIGEPYVHHHYYGYSWWNGRYASLYTWDRALRVHPGRYAFADGSCVELWIRTDEGVDYEIKIDPRYYDARDPGDLYAALWSELEEEGQLQIQDINGAVHVFPAGMIQQIEARGCN